MNKQELVSQVRESYNLTTTQNSWFTKEEMIEIVEKIKGPDYEWTGNNTFFEEELYTMGWFPQQTTDSHPTAENLQFFLDHFATDVVATSLTTSVSVFEDFFNSIDVNLTHLENIHIERDPTVLTLTFSE